LLKYLRPAGPFPILPQEMVAKVAAGDFHLFEMFIWIASAIGVLRLATGVCSRATLERSRNVLSNINRKGFSTKMLVLALVLLPLMIVFCLDFKLAAESSIARAILISSPRAFVCLQSFLFCASVVFIVEIMLSLIALVFIRSRPAQKQANAE
jgi:hypothetical protein